MTIEEHMVLLLVYIFSYLESLVSPAKKDDSTLFLVETVDDSFCKLLPSHLLVTVTLALLHCEDGVEHEHPLSAPATQVAMDWIWHAKGYILILH